MSCFMHIKQNSIAEIVSTMESFFGLRGEANKYPSGLSLRATVERITVHNDGRLVFIFTNGSEETVMM